ncbi:GNAT family N-acetyltransferase [uncultured Roseobacter sp.]|uniref:GNAT family N-acetyltransferase n=1 Tax=uncultured Roseobacter sp. TaxID=114847 RepID=UPI00262BE0B1|nr:GNAT family N-acetyltransferase [uncultured Roseobacter sp.]
MAFMFPQGFDPQPSLQAGDMTLRPIEENDRDGMTEAASDPLIWSGHPAHDRHDSAVFSAYFDMLLSSSAALTIRDLAGRIIGCTVYYTDTNAPLRLSIGFTFLVRDHWGGITNRIVKRLTLAHLFETSTEAWFHIAPSNLRSQKATSRLGAVYTHEADIDLGSGSTRWCCYCLTREGWQTNDSMSVLGRRSL